MEIINKNVLEVLLVSRVYPGSTPQRGRYQHLSYLGSQFPLQSRYQINYLGAVTFSFTGSLTYQTSTITYSSAMTNSTLKTPVLGITDLRYIMSSAGILLQVVY